MLRGYGGGGRILNRRVVNCRACVRVGQVAAAAAAGGGGGGGGGGRLSLKLLSSGTHKKVKFSLSKD